MVEADADAKFLEVAARFNLATGCPQTGPCEEVVCEEVLDSASTLELEPLGVDVEADAEACAEDVFGTG